MTLHLTIGANAHITGPGSICLKVRGSSDDVESSYYHHCVDSISRMWQGQGGMPGASLCPADSQLPDVFEAIGSWHILEH